MLNARRNKKCPVITRKLYVFCVWWFMAAKCVRVIGECQSFTRFRSDDHKQFAFLHVITVIRHVLLCLRCFAGYDVRGHRVTSSPSERCHSLIGKTRLWILSAVQDFREHEGIKCMKVVVQSMDIYQC